VLYSELFAAALRAAGEKERPAAVEALIENAFAISRPRFWIQKNQPVQDANGLRRFRRHLRRLLAGEPLAYILGEKEFYGETLLISPAVLVPRPETELLVEKALELLGRAAVPSPTALSGHEGPRVLDIGAGSGAIAIILALRSRAAVTALEKSRPALAVLKRNIARFGLQARVQPLRGDLFPRRTEPFQMIVANPPYLSRRDWRQAPASVRLYEPREALLAGPSGFEALARIVEHAPRWLKPGGWLLLEIGKGQRRAVSGFLKAAGLREVACVLDYAGIERVIVAQKN
jgi:release factor glutamine methyltransferase